MNDEHHPLIPYLHRLCNALEQQNLVLAELINLQIHWREEDQARNKTDDQIVQESGGTRERKRRSHEVK